MKTSVSDKCKVIAEIGLSHEGSLGLAKSSIDAALNAGADIVKFQVHSSFHESSKNEKFRINFSDQDSTRSEYWERTSFSYPEWQILINHCEKIGIEFSASVFNAHSLQQMIDLGVNTIKLGSGDLINHEFQEILQDYSGYLILSTGMATWSEIGYAVKTYEKFHLDRRLAILQCTSKYPTALNQVGINVMEEISNTLKVDSGLSDHTNNLSASYVAIVKGAKYLEKHVVFSRLMFGPDVSSSIDFSELKQLCDFRNDFLEIVKPIEKDQIAEELLETRILFGRSLGLKKDFPQGHELKITDFCLRKPHGGLTWANRLDLVGMKLVKPYFHDEILESTHLRLGKN